MQWFATAHDIEIFRKRPWLWSQPFSGHWPGTLSLERCCHPKCTTRPCQSRRKRDVSKLLCHTGCMQDQSCLVATTQKTKQNQKDEPAARTCRNACLGQSEVVGLARERCLHLTIERTRHVLSIFTLMLPRLFLSQGRVFFDAITDMPELGDTVKGCRKLIEEKG